MFEWMLIVYSVQQKKADWQVQSTPYQTERQCLDAAKAVSSPTMYGVCEPAYSVEYPP